MTPAELIEKHEARIPWMYLDSVGKVTVGVGECLETAAEANRVFGQDVSRAYARVKAMPTGFSAQHYQYPDCPMLTDTQMTALRDRSIALATNVVRNHIKNFDTLTDSRKAVLVDMSFNLGPEGFAGFKNTIALVNAGRFADAADHMLNSLWAKQVPSRAKEDADLMRSA